jgi:hypothetical protein
MDDLYWAIHATLDAKSINEKRCRWLVVDIGEEPLYYVAN